ncbi:MAG: hypothetical protein NTY19_51295 [Planctomycetota bacterium]|nr:hypothetical protein [Planctomycetota bacterium]
MKAEIERYLSTGDSDPRMTNWPGNNVLERLKRGEERLKAALLAEIRRRAARVPIPSPESMPGDLVTFARAKLEPMVRGLFPRVEQERVLGLLEESVTFLTPETIEPLLRGPGFLGTAWAVANIYLVGIGAKPLGDEMQGVVGMSEETTCYVSLAYFADDHPFSDFVVHEAAHIFHNAKRRTAGLPETRRRQWLLPIEFGKRETFAYACEAYSRLLELAQRPADRRRALENLKQGPLPPRGQVDAEEYLEILAEAVSRRNGWKAILERCSQKKP